MSYLPEFEDDIFISYAHLDNEPLTEGQKGWIDVFHRALEVLLRKNLGSDPIIWRDNELRGNEYFADKLVNVLAKTAVLVPVLSPGYVNSEWCLREIQEFCRRAEQAGTLRVADKARIFKVLRTVVPMERHPPEIAPLHNYDFFAMDVVTNRPREFSPELGTEAKEHFFERMGDLAYDIVQLLQMLKDRQTGEQKPTASDPGTTVYLAETTADQGPARDAIRRELLQRGYTVLPDKPLPLTAPELEQAVGGYLRRSRLSVHLIGEYYGIIPETESRSLVCLQNELASKRSDDVGFSRLVWMPVGLAAKEERQQKFIEYLQRDEAAQQGAELLQTPLEELKGCIEDKLKQMRKAPPPAPVAEGSPARVYLVYDAQDAEAIRPLADYLFEQGCETIEPLHDGDETQVREDHKENLVDCDAVLIYYGKAGEIWLRGKLRDLQKAAGYGRTKPLLAKAIYVAGPESPAKQAFRTHEAEVVKNFGAFSAQSLASFAAEIKEAKGRRP